MNRGIGALQARALPLGYGTILLPDRITSRSRLYNIANQHKKCKCLKQNLLYFSYLIRICQFSQKPACVKTYAVHTILKNMYEMMIGAGADYLGWLKKIESDINSCGITAVTVCSVGKNKAYLNIGAESNISGIRKLIVKSVENIILNEIKTNYIARKINTIKICSFARNILIHALAGFDRDTEKVILDNKLHIGKQFDLDGFRYFRMSELYSRWDEMCSLAGRHSEFLRNEDTLYDLIRYLVDSEKKKGARAEVYRFGGKYRLVETSKSGREERIFEKFDDLICRLIDFAPYETILSGFEFDDKYRKLSNIFDATFNILQ